MKKRVSDDLVAEIANKTKDDIEIDYSTGIPVEFQAELGKVCVTYAQLEMDLSMFIWAMIDPNDQSVGHAVTCELSIKGLRFLCSALFKRKSQDLDLIKQLDKILKKSERRVDRRNKIIHSTFGYRDQTGEVIRLKITAKGELKAENEVVRVKELQDIAKDLQHSAGRIRTFSGEMFNQKILQKPKWVNLTTTRLL